MPQIHNLTEAQDLLRPYYNNARTPYTLDTMRDLMEFLGNPQEKLRVLHVAGTSGKTSTAYYCAALLMHAGKKVGLSVSPHVDTVNERLQINGAPLPEADFCNVLGEFIDIIDGSGIQPSYFELLAAMAYWEFARRGVDYAVIEVGLGGLLDGTNVVDRPDKICLITDIGLDHTEILGETLRDIATQKAGIIRPGNTVFMYEQDAEVMDVITHVVRREGADLNAQQNSAAVTDSILPLFQQRNLGLAVAAAQYVLRRDSDEQMTPAVITQAAQTVIPARLERFRVGSKTVIVDGSHNQQKIRTLLESIAALYPQQDIAAVCAFVQGNEERWHGGLTELGSAVEHLIVTGFASEQDVPKASVAPGGVAAYAATHELGSVEVIETPATAYKALLLRPEPVLLITGSFYLLNHIRPLIKEQV
ncbi:MAG TPA: hypothetical protein VGE30_00645 [Candidatus Saccharimonadales bacterium]